MNMFEQTPQRNAAFCHCLFPATPALIRIQFCSRLVTHLWGWRLKAWEQKVYRVMMKDWTGLGSALQSFHRELAQPRLKTEPSLTFHQRDLCPWPTTGSNPPTGQKCERAKTRRAVSEMACRHCEQHDCSHDQNCACSNHLLEPWRTAHLYLDWIQNKCFRNRVQDVVI